MDDKKYIGMDVHQASISIAVRDATGKVVVESIIETKASTILGFIRGIQGSLWITFEEGTSAAWLYDLLKPHVSKVIVCEPRKNALLNAGNKNDRVDARKLSDLLRAGLVTPEERRGVPRREWGAYVAGAGPQLSHHQQRSHARDESSQGALSKLGDSLRW